MVKNNHIWFERILLGLYLKLFILSYALQILRVLPLLFLDQLHICFYSLELIITVLQLTRAGCAFHISGRFLLIVYTDASRLWAVLSLELQ